MNKSLIEFIKNLSMTDKKTLSQKALKTCEETGELAKVILPFENAFATTHRFVDKNKILEEVADVLLCAYSIAFDLNFSEDEIEEMVSEKSKKWAELQARQKKAKFPIPFEIHITVETSEISRFKDVCSMIGVKPVILELQNQTGDAVMTDVMTSSVIMGDNRMAYDEMCRIVDKLNENNFKVVRNKIETVPWHPAAPSIFHMNPVMPKNCYFEAHIVVICSDLKREKLSDIVIEHEAHLSKNIFKWLDDKNYKIMITKRTYEEHFESFELKLHNLEMDLRAFGFEFDKIITEFSVYDTKIGHDSSWIKS